MDPTVDWVPLGGLLSAASNELDVGQLLHTSVFSLFEAMSAVEIGNPKMDAGARPKGDQTPLAQRPLPTDLSPLQLLALMDHLLCLEATWHNGGAAARTLYSSLYMMQPDRTAANPVLSAYCRGVEATSAEVNHLVMTGGVCEEEDFNVHIAGLPLEHATTAAGAPATGMTNAPANASNASSRPGSTAAATAAAAAAAAKSDKVCAALSQAIDGQDVVLKQWQQQQQQGGGSGGSDVAAVAAAIAARLQFRRQLLQGLIKLKRKQKQDLDQACKLFLKARSELASIKDTLNLSAFSGTAAAGALNPAQPASSSSSSSAAAAAAADRVSAKVVPEVCWDENMNNHLIPAVPPRNIKVYSPGQAVEYFDRMLGQLIRVCGITHVNSLTGLKDFLTGFMANGTQPGFNVCPIARSALHSQVSYTAWVPVEQQQQQQQPAADSSGDSCSCCHHDSGSSSGPAGVDQLHHSHIHQPHTAAPDHTAAAAAAGVVTSSSNACDAAAAPPSSPAPAAAAAAAAAAVAAAGDASLPAWVLSPRMLRAALLLSPDEALSDDVDLFIEQAVIAAGNLVQALLMNPSRCRRRLRRGLDDWSNLYQHALNADVSPGFQAYMAVHGWKWTPAHPEEIAGPLSTWVEAETAWVMVRHLLMGFELQLYEPADYTMIYWHVDALTGVNQAGMRMLSQQRPAVITTAAAAGGPKGSSSSNRASSGGGGSASPKLPSKGGSRASKGAGGSGNSGSNAAAAAAATAAMLQAYSQQSALAQLFDDVYKLLSMGTVRVLLALPLLGMWSPPQLLFNSPAQRYDQRFASFHTVPRPDPLAYEQFVASTDVTGASAEQLLRLAQADFAKAHQACVLIKAQGPAMGLTKQQQQELPQLDRVASTNNVAMVLLMRTAATAAAGGSKGSNGSNGAAVLPLKPLWEFGHHKWFPTLVLKSAAAAKQQ